MRNLPQRLDRRSYLCLNYRQMTIDSQPLRRDAEGLFLRQVSDGSITEVDGETVNKGGRAQIKPGTKVRIGGVLTLSFLSANSGSDHTLVSERGNV